MNKDAQAKAIDKIVQALQNENVEASNKQVHEKLTKLRNYYGAERWKKKLQK